MNIKPIAFFHSPMTSKFGVPRQSGLVPTLPGRIVLEPEYRHEEAVRGLEAFSHLWIIWEFSANRSPQKDIEEAKHNGSQENAVATSPSRLTVRPPRLGGNERIGVFASRSPFRPNGLGLSCVKIKRIELSKKLGPVIHVEGADLMDGTPIYDLKPYVVYADAHPEAHSGFVDQREWKELEVEIPEETAALFSDDELQGLRGVLAQDPRPRYHDDPKRVYGMPYAGRDVRFQVCKGKIRVVEVGKC